MFSDLKKAVQKQFELMHPHGLYRVSVDKDLLWEKYLGSFPPGTDPLFKERTEHDCQCCKHFIRAVGGLVTIVNGSLMSIWDVEVPEPYQAIVKALSEFVKSQPIDNVFLTPEKVIGTDKNHSEGPNGVLTWEHFSVKIPAAFVMKGEDIGTKLGETRSTKDVFLRSLKEISLDSLDTVLELIAQNSLYRGEENRFAVEAFRKLKKEFDKAKNEELFVWARVAGTPTSVSKIRSTAIGTLLVDLSEGGEMDAAVASFEAKVAPANYKRPTALVTKAMIQKAQQKIEELGFTSALERRYATLDDITINNILFADRSVRSQMNVFDSLSAAVPDKVQKMDKVEEVGVEKFLSDVLPKAESLEVMFENRHAGNLVSLVAPVHPDAKGMFKWPNNFSWSYAGDVADSIKERVKRAGGSVEGDLCCRLAWDYTDDLDFHMLEPHSYHISYLNRRTLSASGGMLDVDANGADGLRPDPVENIFYRDRHKMTPGVYTLKVNNYNRRSSGTGFEVEVEFEGTTHHFAYEKALRTGETITVAEIEYKNGVFKITSPLPSSQTSKTVWSLPTQAFHKVNVVALSPNYWDEKTVGNKHYFFLLDGCRNEDRARGFFNEFLSEELNVHRKVLEVVGAKMKTEEADNQLSGLGFSSTQRNYILARVKGSFNRVVKIVF